MTQHTVSHPMKKDRIGQQKLFRSIWLFLSVYLLLVSGPDILLPWLFAGRSLPDLLAWRKLLSEFAGYLILAAPLFFLRGRSFRIYAVGLISFASVGFCLCGFVISRFRMPLQAGMLDLLSTTSWRETGEFLLREAASLSLAYAVAAVFFCTAVIRAFGRHVEPWNKRRPGFVLGAACIAPMILLAGYYIWIKPDPVLRGSSAWYSLLPHKWAYYRKSLEPLQQCVIQPEIPADLTLSGPADTAVIVIGESASREHLSLYGYERETTPRLDAIRSELVVFRDVISAMPVTNFALYYALTFKTLADPAHPRATFFSVLEKAGYEVSVFSTQENFGDRSVSALFEKWNPSYYVRKYDAQMLPDIKAALAKRKGPALLVLHIMGSHITYKNRYPAGFRKFVSPDETEIDVNPLFRENVDTYDNSIYYTDYFLGQLIDALRESGGRNFLFYFSDHGENVETSFLQNYRDSKNPQSYEVPFLFWFSPEYRAAYPDRVAAAAAAVDKPLQMDRTTQGILSVFGVSSKAYPQENNFFSPLFPILPRTLMEGQMAYPDDRAAVNSTESAAPDEFAASAASFYSEDI